MSDNRKSWLLDGEMYQYNLGWLIDKILSFESDLATAIDLKTIKYADPIQWDITTQYTANTVVIDPKTGVAYMSKVPVPAGVDLENENYWVKVFDFLSIYNRIMDGVATNERRSDYASKDYAVNDLVWYSEHLYRVTRAIEEGAKFIPGTNITETTIESCLERYYGKDRFAQVANDTLNISGDYTINAGDIAETADNKTVKITDTYHLDAKNADAKVSSDSFPVEFLTKTVDLFDIGKTMLDATAYGVDTTLADISDALNAVIAAYGGKQPIYIPAGYYRVKKPVLINNAATRLVCDGSIELSENGTIKILNHSCSVSFNKGIYGVSATCGLQLGDSEMSTTVGNCLVYAPYIDNCNVGIRLIGSNGYGVQNCDFYLNRINGCDTGISIECGNGASWVNQNAFYNAWIAAPAKESAVGVKFTKGNSQTDHFNGNSFYSFSCETVRYPIAMDFADSNIFENLRMLENTGTDLIKCTNTCNSNKFKLLASLMAIDSISDAGTYNRYSGRFLYQSNLVVGDLLAINGSPWIRTPQNIGAKFSYTQTTIMDTLYNFKVLELDSSAYNCIVALPASCTLPSSKDPFIVKMKGTHANTTAEIRTFAGTVLASTSDSTLKANTSYLFTPIGANTYDITEL